MLGLTCAHAQEGDVPEEAGGGGERGGDKAAGRESAEPASGVEAASARTQSPSTSSLRRGRLSLSQQDLQLSALGAEEALAKSWALATATAYTIADIARVLLLGLAARWGLAVEVNNHRCHTCICYCRVV
jgi:hypothetical protein